MRQLGDEVEFYYSGWGLTGTIVSVTDDPERKRGAQYTLKCNKFAFVRFHFNKDDEMVWVEPIV